MNEKLECDLYRNFLKIKIPLRRRFTSNKYKFFFYYRLYHSVKTDSKFDQFVRKFSNYQYTKTCSKLGIDMPISISIGKGLYIPHFNGIVIHPKVKIGDYCSILQQVTIGNNIQKGLNSVATIGDNVFLGAGSKIIGPCQIGNNSILGANSVNSKDIPTNTVFAGIPAKYIRSNNEKKIFRFYK